MFLENEPQLGQHRFVSQSLIEELLRCLFVTVAPQILSQDPLNASDVDVDVS